MDAPVKAMLVSAIDKSPDTVKVVPELKVKVPEVKLSDSLDFKRSVES